jgi:hypothetical protein
MRKKGITPGGLTPTQERARDLLAALDADPSRTGRTNSKLGAARAAVTKLVNLARTQRLPSTAETFAAACAAVNTSGDAEARGEAKRRVNDVLRAFGKLPSAVPPYQERAANLLREMFEGDEATAEVTAALKTLAQLLRVELPDATDELPGFYLRAFRKLDGDVRAAKALITVYQSAACANWKRQNAAAEQTGGRQDAPAGGKPSAPKKQGPRVLYVLDVTADSDTVRILGLVPGDSCNVYEAAPDDLKPGDAAALELKEFAAAGRFVSSDAGRVTIRDDRGEEGYDRDEILSVGRVDILNPWKTDRLAKEQRARVNKLRSDLEDLAGEDDRIIRCTRRYELEKEIFDITHPAGGDADDWSAWEEEEEDKD